MTCLRTRLELVVVVALFFAPAMGKAVQRSLTPADANHRFRAALENQYFGYMIGTGPHADVNGDGVEDLIISIDDAPPGSQACLSWGDPTIHEQDPQVVHDLGEAGTCDVTITGSEPFGEDGTGVIMADFDGDGFGDVAFQSHGADVDTPGGGSRASAGRISILRGGSDLPADISLDSPPAGVMTRLVFGDDELDQLGVRLAAGDLNGDGFHDLAAAVWRGDGPADGRTDAGGAYVIFGSSDFFSAPDLDLSVSAPDGTTLVQVFGEEAGDRMVGVWAGDVDGDGSDDLLLGSEHSAGPANDRSRAGSAMRLAGRATWPATVDLSVTPPDNLVHGARAGDSLGWSTFVTDHDGDGTPDWVVATPNGGGPDQHANDDPAGPPDGLGDLPYCGEIYVLDGTSLTAEIDLALGVPGTWFHGASPNLFMDVCGVGDLDSDGFGDIVTCGGTDADVLVVRGREEPPESSDLSVVADDAFTGMARGAGYPVGVLDYDGDGFDDLVIGAPLEPVDAFARAGEVYVVLSPVLSSYRQPDGSDCWSEEAGVGFHTCWSHRSVAEAVNLYRVDCGAPTLTDLSWCARPNVPENPSDPESEQWIRVTDDDPGSAPDCSLYVLTNVVDGGEQSFGRDSNGEQRPAPSPACP